MSLMSVIQPHRLWPNVWSNTGPMQHAHEQVQAWHVQLGVGAHQSSAQTCAHGTACVHGLISPWSAG
jgi:hypothetical protein